jgi:hypothetical protein
LSIFAQLWRTGFRVGAAGRYRQLSRGRPSQLLEPGPSAVHSVNRKCASGLPRWLARVIRNVMVDREVDEIEDAEVRRASQELTAERAGARGAGTLSWQSCA